MTEEAPFEGPIESRAWARAIDVSEEAIELYRSCDVIDLHIDTPVPMRLVGYDPTKRHRARLAGTPLMNQVDLPRIRKAGLTGVVWDIATNPLRRMENRPHVAAENLRRQAALFERFPNDFELVGSAQEYRRAREAGRTAIWLSIQGGQALDRDPHALDVLCADRLHRVTLLHLTPSRIGVPSNLARRAGDGLTAFGRDFVAALDERGILVDLAHINRRGFFDAIDAHDRSIPLIVSHTGVQGVRAHWRNIDDDQIRAVAETGGTIGIIFHRSFVAQKGAPCTVARIVDHIEHVIETAGEDHVSFGSDFDGCIVLPLDLVDVTWLPRLVQSMLNRRWSRARIVKVLGGNYLRVVEAIRPGSRRQ